MSTEPGPTSPRKRKYVLRPAGCGGRRRLDLGRIARALHGRSREELIREAAYARAALRGFSGGDPVADWLAAEREVDARLRDEGRRELDAAPGPRLD
jgi:hypothetical protein